MSASPQLHAVPHAPAAKRATPPSIFARKGGTPLVMLTAYTARMAELLDRHCDVLLVGDSVGQVIYGLPSTLPVTTDMMIAHGAAVVRGSRQSLIVVDLPFGSYEESPQQAFATAARILRETNAGAVKLEGGAHLAPTIKFLVERGIPVMAHLGLTPQAINRLGGYGARGKSKEEYTTIRNDALAVQRAGAFCIVLEAVMESLAQEITRMVPCPTIGIGASPDCDGQVLVVDDMLGMFERTARFVGRFETLGRRIEDAAAVYARDVRDRTFPTAAHLYGSVAQGGKP